MSDGILFKITMKSV